MIFPVFDPAAGTYNIYAAKPDGSARSLVVLEASQPAMSADGQRIAYRSWQANNRGLMVRAIEGGDPYRFNSSEKTARPSFSPKGEDLLFHSQEHGEEPAIYRYYSEQDRYEVLHPVLLTTSAIQGESPTWTLDNRFIYSGCLQGGNCGLIVRNLDGSSPYQITQDPSDTNPVVSPDGQSVVFMSRRHGDWDVFRVAIDGSDLAQLTFDNANDGLPTWSPDGSMIAFVSNRDGAWRMWVMNNYGHDKHLLYDLGGSIHGIVDQQNSKGWEEERIVWARQANGYWD